MPKKVIKIKKKRQQKSRKEYQQNLKILKKFFSSESAIHKIKGNEKFNTKQKRVISCLTTKLENQQSEVTSYNTIKIKRLSNETKTHYLKRISKIKKNFNQSNRLGAVIYIDFSKNKKFSFNKQGELTVKSGMADHYIQEQYKPFLNKIKFLKSPAKEIDKIFAKLQPGDKIGFYHSGIRGNVVFANDEIGIKQAKKYIRNFRAKYIEDAKAMNYILTGYYVIKQIEVGAL